MPTYEYECQACGHEFEKFQSMKARPVRKCPVCGKNKVQRLIGTGAGIIFKGSGFYETDYKRDGSYKESAKKDSESSGSSDSGKEKSESKNASGDAKAENKTSETKKSDTKASK